MGKAKSADKAKVGEKASAPAAEEAQVVGAPVDPNEPEVVAEGGAGKAPDQLETAPGRFVVVAFKDGSRMYNERGQAVSAVVTEGAEITRLTRQAARSNALNKGRNTKTPLGHSDPDAE